MTKSHDEPAGQRFYSKDYWDIVFEQLGRRKLFRVSMVVLALLYASAIYAPLIANDKPYVLEAIDYKAYNSANSLMSATTSSIARLLKETPEEYAASRGADAPDTLSGAMSVEREALVLKLAVMEEALPVADHGALDALLGEVDAALAKFAAGDQEASLAAADEAKKTARALKKEYLAKAPETEGAAPEGKQLMPKKTYPLFASLSPFAIFLMVFWFLLMLWPLWNRMVNRALLDGDRERIRRARHKKTLFMLGVPVLSSFFWFLGNGFGGGAFAVGPYKTGLTEGDIVAISPPVFPPLVYGFAETHGEESFRPPTWTRNSEVNEEGYYVHGFRVPKADPVTGYMQPPTPTVVRVGEPERNAVMRHPMGTDELGRDFLVRLLWGGQVSLSVGILSALLLTVIGVVTGSIAGYFGGWTDILIMRLIEVLQSIPAFFLILVVMAFTDPEVVPPIVAIVVVIALVRWTGVARLVRGEFLRLREAEFVLAANALGFRASRTIFRHVLPNALSPIIVSAAFSVAAGILTESAISFLGFGIQHPGASWGSLVNESRNPEHWWVQVFPGLVIFLTVTCYNLAGDALRDALDPKLKD